MTDGGWADYKRSLSGFSGFDSGITTLKDKAKIDKTKVFEMEKLGIGDVARQVGETKATLDTVGETAGGLATTMLSVRSFGGMKKLLGQVRDKIGGLEPKSGEKNSVSEGAETKADSAEQPAEAENSRSDMERAFGTEEEQNETPDWMKPAFEKNNAEDIPDVPTVDNAPKTIADLPEDNSIIRGPRELAEPDELDGRFLGRHDFLDNTLGKGKNYLKQRRDMSGRLLEKPREKGGPGEEPEEDTTQYTKLEDLPDAEFPDIGKASQSVESVGKTATQTVESVGEDLKGTIADTTEDLTSKAGDTLKSLGGKLLGGADEAAEDATEAATAGVEEAADAAIGAGAQALDAIPIVGEIVGAVVGIGTAIAGGIEAGVQAKDEEKETDISKQELQINAASMIKNQYGNSVTPTLTSMTQMPSNSGIF